MQCPGQVQRQQAYFQPPQADFGKEHVQTLSHMPDNAGMPSHKAPAVYIKIVPVPTKVFDADHALHRHVGQFHKNAKIHDARNDATELSAHAG